MPKMTCAKALIAAAGALALAACGERADEAAQDAVRTLSPSEAATRDLKAVADAYLRAIVESVSPRRTRWVPDDSATCPSMRSPLAMLASTTFGAARSGSRGTRSS